MSLIGGSRRLIAERVSVLEMEICTVWNFISDSETPTTLLSGLPIFSAHESLRLHELVILRNCVRDATPLPYAVDDRVQHVKRWFSDSYQVQRRCFRGK